MTRNIIVTPKQKGSKMNFLDLIFDGLPWLRNKFNEGELKPLDMEFLLRKAYLLGEYRALKDKEITL